MYWTVSSIPFNEKLLPHLCFISQFIFTSNIIVIWFFITLVNYLLENLVFHRFWPTAFGKSSHEMVDLPCAKSRAWEHLYILSWSLPFNDMPFLIFAPEWCRYGTFNGLKVLLWGELFWFIQVFREHYFMLNIFFLHQSFLLWFTLSCVFDILFWFYISNLVYMLKLSVTYRPFELLERFRVHDFAEGTLQPFECAQS